MNSENASWYAGESFGMMDRIASPYTNMVVWNRTIGMMLGFDLSAWARLNRKPFDQKITLHDGMIDDLSLSKLARSVNDLPLSASDFLFRDFGSLTNTFARLSGTNTFRMFFGVVNDNQCRKFHADFLRLRMLCTYSGLGTEWAPNYVVNREAMIDSSNFPEIANSAIITNMARVKRAAVGDVLLMKGNNYGEIPGVVHRSPPIEISKQSRVVLVLSDMRKKSK